MLPSRRSVTCVALLAFASGCSRGSESRTTLFPFVDSRGVITYSTNDPYDPAVEEYRRIARWQEQQDAELNRVRQENMRAEDMRRRERQAQFSQEQKDLQAYEDTRRENQREQLRQSQAREQQLYEQQQRQSNERRIQSSEAVAMQLQRDALELDRALQRIQQQQQQDMLLRQHR